MPATLVVTRAAVAASPLMCHHGVSTRSCRSPSARSLQRIPRFPSTSPLSHDLPADALLGLADDSAVVVVGRRHPRTPLPSHIGPVTRAVLRWSPVPVLVVDPVASDDRLKCA